MGIDRHEPSTRQVLENISSFQGSRELFVVHGWFQFFNRFSGYDDEVSLQFSKTFDGDRSQVGAIVLTVSEQSISHATGLPMEGERWFKKGKLNRDQINRLLKPEFHLVKLGKGFPSYFLYEEWQQSSSFYRSSLLVRVDIL